MADPAPADTLSSDLPPEAAAAPLAGLGLDWGLIVFGLLLCAAFVVLGLRAAGAGRHDGDRYLVARNAMGVRSMVATLVASMSGMWILFSVPDAFLIHGGLVAVIGYALAQAAPMPLFAVFGSRLRHLMPQGLSLVEFARRRYARGFGVAMTLITLFYLWIFLAAELTAIGQAFRVTASVPPLLTAGVVAVAAAAYALRGGAVSSIVTDRVQFVGLVVIMAALTAAVLWMSPGPAFAAAAEANPQAFWPLIDTATPWAGLRFGLVLVIALVVSNLIDQGFWQRVFACRDGRTVWRSYLLAALLIAPVLLLSGLGAATAHALGVVPEGETQTALFHLAREVMPGFGMFLLLGLGLVLVMSSVDTLIAALVSLGATEGRRLHPSTSLPRAIGWAQLGVCAILLAALPIAAQGWSVLYLFFLADLICAGVVVPLFAGLYSRRLPGWGACVAGVLGIASGVLYFPAPDWSPLVGPLPGPLGWLPAGDLLTAFVVPLVVSALVALIIALFHPPRFDLRCLQAADGDSTPVPEEQP